jgi:predicted N-acetyltransferase YhbS
MQFRKFKRSDIRQIATIKNSVYSNFNRSEYFEKKAVLKYLNYTNPKKSDQELLDAFKITKDSIFFVAEEKNEIVGYIKGKKNKIGNLFVLGKTHKKGIGRRLVNLFEKEAIEQNSKEINSIS